MSPALTAAVVAVDWGVGSITDTVAVAAGSSSPDIEQPLTRLRTSMTRIRIDPRSRTIRLPHRLPGALLVAHGCSDCTDRGSALRPELAEDALLCRIRLQ